MAPISTGGPGGPGSPSIRGGADNRKHTGQITLRTEGTIHNA